MKAFCYEKELKIKLRRFKKLIGSLDPERQTILEESIETINLNLIRWQGIITNSLNDVLFNEYKVLNGFRQFWSLLADYTEIDAVQLDDEKYPYPDISDVTNSELLDLTYEFFKNGTSKYFFSIFEQLFKQRKKVFFINSSAPNFYADSMFLNFDKSFYIQMNRGYEFNDISTMAHEYGHGIQYLINYNRNIFYSLQSFSEIVSTFFELICEHYYSKDKRFASKAIITLYDNWYNACIDATTLNQEIGIFNAINLKENEKENKTKRKLDQFIKTSDKVKLGKLLDQQISECFIYTFAYSIATTLFMIYLDDQEFAFYLLQKLIEINLGLSKEEYLKEIINLGIIPNERIMDFDVHLKRELKKY